MEPIPGLPSTVQPLVVIIIFVLHCLCGWCRDRNGKSLGGTASGTSLARAPNETGPTTRGAQRTHTASLAQFQITSIVGKKQNEEEYQKVYYVVGHAIDL